MRRAVHPGAPAPDRLDLLPVRGRAVEVTLAAGLPLLDAVAAAMGGAGGHLELRDAEVSALDYVIPMPSPDGRHVAWYSGARSMGQGWIDRLCLIVGHRDGKPFLHGHGCWTDGSGAAAMGHVLPERTVLSAPVTAQGIAVEGGTFARRHDPEPAFDLFGTEGACVPDADHALLRVRPDEDLSRALDAACVRLGWDAAEAFGIGSLDDARFEDGTVLGSRPTEFYLTDAPVRLGADLPGPEVGIVGVDGGGRTGRLRRGANPVLVTAEIVLRRADQGLRRP